MFTRIFLFSIFSFCSTATYALYNGNPCLPEIPEEGFFLAKEAWMGVRLGYEGDYVFKRRMNHSVSRFKSLQNFATLTLTFNERIEFYGSAGASWCKLRRHISYDTETGLAGKVGTRLIIFHNESTQLTLHGAFLQASMPLKHTGDFRYREAEIGLGLSHQVGWFIPYVGVESSRAWAKVRHSNRDFSAQSRDPVGLFFGAGFTPGYKGIFNLEARFFDEKAVSLSFDLKF